MQQVENGGLLFTDNPAGVSGTDAGFSLPLGRQTLWLFGDMFLLDPHAPSRTYVGGVSNGALLVPAGRGTEPLKRYRFLTEPRTGVARAVIPYETGEDAKTRLWPAGSWYDAERRRIYLFYSRVTNTGGGPLDFRVEGHGLAVADASKPDELLFRRLRTSSGSDMWWRSPGALYGVGVVSGTPPGDPYLYVVGVAERGGRKIGKLVRVLKSQITDRGAYRYLAGSADRPEWGADPGRAADVEGLTDFPNEMSIAYNRYADGYLAVQSVNLDERIRLSLAPQPWGPYRQIAEIGAPKQAFSRAFCYAGKEHPELSEQGGRVVYISYVDSGRYWLQLLKVTLKRDGG